LLKFEDRVAGREAELWNLWLNALPCQEDDTEGHRNHKALVEFVGQGKRELVGENNSNVPIVLKILVEVYKTPMTTEETDKNIGQLIVSLGGNLESASASLSDKQKKKILRIVRDANQPHL